MKILGIDEYEFIGREDGQSHTALSIYLAVKNASKGGLICYDYSVSRPVLENALLQKKFTDYKQLINQECEVSYSYDKERKVRRVHIINLK